MVDFPNPDDVRRVTLEEAARGVNFFDATSSEDIRPSSPNVQFAQSEEIARRSVQKAEELGAVDYGPLSATMWGNILTQNSTGQLAYRLWAPLNTPDEDWIKYKRDEQIRAAQLELPQALWEDLQPALNEQHFQFLLNRAKNNWKAAEQLSHAGMGWGAANFLAQLVNPVDLTIGLGTYYVGGTVAQRAFNLGRRGALVGDALAGAAGAMGSVATQDALGLIVDDSEYLMAAGLGLSLGAGISLFAPSGLVGASGKPSLAREAAERLSAHGQKLIDVAQEKAKAVGRQLQGLPSTQRQIDEAVRDARRATEEPQSRTTIEINGETVVDQSTPVPAAAAPENQAPETAAPAATVGDQVEAAVQSTPLAEIVPPGTVKAVVDEIVPQNAPNGTAKAAREADPLGQPGTLTKPFTEAAKDAGQALDEVVAVEATTEIPLSEALLRNPRNIAAYRAVDGIEYRIVAEDDLSGPFRLLAIENGKARTVTSGLDTLAEARARIPGLDGPQSAGNVAEELQPVLSPMAARIEELKKLRNADKDAHDAAIAALKAENLKLKELGEIALGLMGGTSKYRNKKAAMGAIELFFSRARQTDRRLKNTEGIFALAEAKPLPGKVDEIGGGYRFRGIEYRLTQHEDGLDVYSIQKDGAEIGVLEVGTQDGQRYIQWLGIDDERYKGTSPATHGAMLVAAKHGAPWIPDGTLSADSFPMWAKRLPWVREFYREDPARPGKGWMISPKRLLKDYESLLNDKLSLDNLKASVTGRGEKWEGTYLDNEKRLSKLLDKYRKTIDSLPAEALDQDNLARMFYAKRDPMANVVSKPEMRGIIDEVLNRILPKSVRRQIGDEIDPSGALDGMYRDRVVHVALNADNPLAIAYHETTHALRQLGLLTEKEWKKLVRWANRTDAHTRYRINERYTQERLSKAELDEEAVAHALGDKLAGRALGDADADGILDRIVNALRWVRDALGIRGFRTLQDIFDDIDNGVIAQRPLMGDLNDAAFRAARRPASSLITGTRNYLEATSPFQEVDEAGVPYTGGWGRFDRAGVMGKSIVAIERLIGRHLLTDPVGMADHSATVTGANHIQKQLHDKAIYRYSKAAKAAFDKWADDEGLSVAQRWTRFDEFFERVGLFMRERAQDPMAEAPHPAIAQVASRIAEIQADYLKLFKDPLQAKGLKGGRPLPGSEHVDEDLTYLWRKYSYDKVVAMTSRLADGEMIKLFRAAIQDANQDFSDELLDRYAEGYFRQLHRASVGLEDEWGRAIATKDAKKFGELLKQDIGASQAEVDSLLRKVLGEKADADAGASFLKRRAILNDTLSMPLKARDGSTVTVSISDLLENNANVLMEHYSRLSSGMVAMGAMQVRTPSGKLIVNGIVNDSEFDDLIKNVEKWAADRGLHHDVRDSVVRLRWAYDRVMGRPMPEAGKTWAKVAQLVRSYMTMRLMGQGGVAQLGETGTTVGTLGVAAAFSHFPSMKRIIDEATGDLRFADQLTEDLANIGLAGPLHRVRYRNIEEFGRTPYQVEQESLLDRFVRYGRVGEDLTHVMSGMTPIQVAQVMHTGKAIVTRMAEFGRILAEGRNLDEGWRRRLAQLDLDPSMVKRIYAELKSNNSLEDNPLFPGKKVHALNLNKWTDLEARAHFEQAVYRLANKIIQTGDEGTLATFMDKEIAKTMLQFRNFPLSAWANHFQYNLHMRDPQMVFNFIWSVGWAAVIRALQVKAIAATRSDGAEYEEKNLNLWALGKAGFERSGWASIIPMGVDTVSTVLGQGAMFSARSTGQVSSIFGIPPLSMADTLSTGLGGAINSVINGREMSQQEIRAGASMLPWMNMIPSAMALSYLISDRPERAPKERPRLY